VRSDYDAFVLFETLNDRGLSLSESDLLKNHLLAAAGPHLKETQADWETIEGNLGGERLLKFVRHHWLSSRGMTSRAGLYPDIKRMISSPEAVAAYTEELCAASEYYDALRDPGSRIWASFGPGHQTGLRERVECLGLLRSDQIFVVLLAALETDPEGFPDLLDMLISFTFRYTTICNQSPSALLPVFIAAARHIRDTGRVDHREPDRRYLIEPPPVLHDDRVAKPVAVLEVRPLLGDRARVHLPPAAELQGRPDPPGAERHQQEDQQRHPDHRRDHQQQAAENVRRHGKGVRPGAQLGMGCAPSRTQNS